jgi:predicted DNA-binding helix-hairpin-helix protein
MAMLDLNAKRLSADGLGLGSTEGMGICHAFAPDGRCRRRS